MFDKNNFLKLFAKTCYFELKKYYGTSIIFESIDAEDGTIILSYKDKTLITLLFEFKSSSFQVFIDVRGENKYEKTLKYNMEQEIEVIGKITSTEIKKGLD